MNPYPYPFGVRVRVSQEAPPCPFRAATCPFLLSETVGCSYNCTARSRQRISKHMQLLCPFLLLLTLRSCSFFAFCCARRANEPLPDPFGVRVRVSQEAKLLLFCLACLVKRWGAVLTLLAFFALLP